MTAQVLVLNADHSFINIVDWRRAIKLISKGKAEIVEATQKVIQNCDGSTQFVLPAVIKLVQFIKSIYKAKVPFNKQNLMIRDNHQCQYCGITEKNMTIDHVIPVSQGGATNWENCVLACHTCNRTKADRTPQQARMQLRNKPRIPNIIGFLQKKFEQLIS